MSNKNNKNNSKKSVKRSDIPNAPGKQFVHGIDENNEELRVMEEALESDTQFYLKSGQKENLSAYNNESITEFNKKYHINPKVSQKPELREQNILLSVRHLKQFFFFGHGAKRQKLKAVSNISFDVHEGECVGIVGESGCGKTTTGRSIIRLYDITSGSIYYRGVRISAGNRWNKKEIKWTRKKGKQQIEELKNSGAADADARIAEIKKNIENTRIEQKE